MLLTHLYPLLFRFTYAAVCSPHLTAVGQLAAAPNHILNVNQVGEPDRKLASDYAEAKGTDAATVEAHFAATGDFVCNGKASSANLVLVSDVVTISAHGGADNKCVDAKSLAGCKVTFEIDKQKKTYDVAGLIETGWPCPKKKGKEIPGSDWAVLRLSQPVDSRIKPYRIDTSFTKRLVDNTPISVVGKSQDFPPGSNNSRLVDKPRHYADCTNKTTNGVDYSINGLTDCDVSPGSSGGGVFLPERFIDGSKPPVLVGIVENTSQGAPGCPASTRTQKRGDYMEKCYNTENVLISGDFKDALVKIQNEQAPNTIERKSLQNNQSQDL